MDFGAAPKSYSLNEGKGTIISSSGSLLWKSDYCESNHTIP